jgi:hypothetical protein
MIKSIDCFQIYLVVIIYNYEITGLCLCFLLSLKPKLSIHVLNLFRIFIRFIADFSLGHGSWMFTTHADAWIHLTNSLKG